MRINIFILKIGKSGNLTLKYHYPIWQGLSIDQLYEIMECTEHNKFRLSIM